MPSTKTIELEDKKASEKKLGSKYFKWDIKEHTVVAIARKDNPYRHYCPIIHFRTILKTIIEVFKSQNIINTDITLCLKDKTYHLTGLLRENQKSTKSE